MKQMKCRAVWHEAEAGPSSPYSPLFLKDSRGPSSKLKSSWEYSLKTTELVDQIHSGPMTI